MTKSAKPIDPPKDEIGKLKNACPWCNYDGVGEDGEKHIKVKEEYFVRSTGTGYYQCDLCGKSFEKGMINKPWSLEVERGSAWARENKIKELGGRA